MAGSPSEKSRFGPSELPPPAWQGGAGTGRASGGPGSYSPSEGAELQPQVLGAVGA